MPGLLVTLPLVEWLLCLLLWLSPARQSVLADDHVRQKLQCHPFAAPLIARSRMSDSVIIRRKVASNFTVLDNAIIRDTRLSWKALGLLVRLLSLPPNFKLRLVTLSQERPSGRDATRSGLKELEETGYLTIVRERESSGKFTTTTWIIQDKPKNQPRSGNPNVAKPVTVSTRSGKPTLVSTDLKQELNITTTTEIGKNVRPEQVSDEQRTLAVPAELSAILPIIKLLPLSLQQDIVDEIEGKLRRGVLRASPVGLAKYFADNPGSFVLSDGMEVRRARTRILEDKDREKQEAEQRKAYSEKLTAELAQMTDQEFSSMCAKLPPRIRNRIVQQRLEAFAEQSMSTAHQGPVFERAIG